MRKTKKEKKVKSEETKNPKGRAKAEDKKAPSSKRPAFEDWRD